MFPNGMVITPDGKTLDRWRVIWAATNGVRYRRGRLAEQSATCGRISGRVPDGICLDAENAIWVACPTASEVIRVKQGGEIAERIKVETDAFACMLGGPDGRTLFVATAPNSDPEKCRATRGGRIETTQVEVPRAGLP